MSLKLTGIMIIIVVYIDRQFLQWNYDPDFIDDVIKQSDFVIHVRPCSGNLQF